MKVTLFGTGYVGLVTGAGLAEIGHQVVCMDVNPERIAQLNEGKIPIYEPNLDTLVERNFRYNRLSFTTDAEEAVNHGEILMIAVGTPSDEDGSADITHVLDVAKSIGHYMSDSKLIVNKSTSPVGSAKKITQIIADCLVERQSNFEFSVVSNPEFLKEGQAIEDFLKPDRIIIGADNPRAIKQMQILYAPFNRNRDRLLIMNVHSAELSKYAANAMLATKISFMNEMAYLAEKLGADIEQVRIGIGSDPRIGYQFIYPGCGYGGSCFPKDVRAVLSMGEQVDCPMSLLHAVDQVNEKQKKRLYQRVHNHFGENLQELNIGIWGLSFKPNTDDVREASSLVLIESLLKAGVHIKAYDPVVKMEKLPQFVSSIQLVTGPEEAAKEVDALIICTEWPEFRAPDFAAIGKNMRQCVIIDGRNMYDPILMKEYGFKYYAVGRGDAVKHTST